MKNVKYGLILFSIFMAPAIIVGIITSIIAYHCGYNDGKKENTPATTYIESSLDSEPEPDTPKLNGVDISGWQKKRYKEIIDTEDYDFVICRATDGIDVDTNCDKAYQYAKSKGKLLGVYFFAYPKLHNAVEYAAFCASTVEGYIGEAVFILDCERSPNEKWILTWIQEFEHITGVKPLVYANLSMVELMDWGKIIDNGNKLWLAYYDIDDGKYYEIPDDIGDWSRDQVVLHQYTTAGRGDSESLDLDVFFGDEEAWQALAKKTN